MTEHKRSRLTLWIVIAIVAAIVFALVLPTLSRIGISQDDIADAATRYDDVARLLADGDIEAARSAVAAHRAGYVLTPLRLGGEIFLRLLKMVVVPLVVASVMTGILGMGDVRQLGRPGLLTLVFYLSTTVLAVVVGLVVVNIIDPGIGGVAQIADAASTKQELYTHLAAEIGASDDDVAKALGDTGYIEQKHRDVWRILENLVLMLFTDNLFRSAVNMDLLPLIAFSIVFAALLTTIRPRVETIIRFVEQANEALMALILFIMRFAPLGIFCLVAARFGQANARGEFLAELQKTGWYSASVLIGLSIHGFITLPVIVWICTKRNPYRFIGQMSQALLTAFSTSSSSATLPVTIECAVDRAGVSRKSTDLVVPLGATINMDGTALYEAVACIFIAQVAGRDLGLTEQIIVAVTATLAAIGAAGIPEAGLVTMVIVLSAVNLPIEYISIILSVDWLLDRFRTMVNVFGDACGAAVIERTIPDTSQPAVAGATPIDS